MFIENFGRKGGGGGGGVRTPCTTTTLDPALECSCEFSKKSWLKKPQFMRAVHQQPGRAIEIFLGTLLNEVPAGGPGGGGGAIWKYSPGILSGRLYLDHRSC